MEANINEVNINTTKLPDELIVWIVDRMTVYSGRFTSNLFNTFGVTDQTVRIAIEFGKAVMEGKINGIVYRYTRWKDFHEDLMAMFVYQSVIQQSYGTNNNA